MNEFTIGKRKERLAATQAIQEKNITALKQFQPKK
jgi:hypothetical protein